MPPAAIPSFPDLDDMAGGTGAPVPPVPAPSGGQFSFADRQIIIRGEFPVADIAPPSFIFLPLVTLLREALPFTRLIGQGLRP
jgi:hypothetical protein